MRAESLKTWRLIHACCRQGSLAKAAMSEGMELSDASRRIAAIEAALGFRLLDRSTRPAGLTDNIRRLAPAAAKIARAAREIETIAREIREEESAEREVRTIRLSLPINMDRSSLLLALHEFEKSRGVRIELSADSGIPALVAGKTDVSMGGYEVSDPAVFSEPAERSYNFLMATGRYLERHGRPERVEDLARHRLLLRNHSNRFFSNCIENDGTRFYIPESFSIFHGDASSCREMLAPRRRGHRGRSAHRVRGRCHRRGAGRARPSRLAPHALELQRLLPRGIGLGRTHPGADGGDREAGLRLDSQPVALLVPAARAADARRREVGGAD